MNLGGMKHHVTSDLQQTKENHMCNVSILNSGSMPVHEISDKNFFGRESVWFRVKQTIRKNAWP
jgi:hypothetical protein